MGIHVEWDNQDHTTICQKFDRHWTWDDFYSAKHHADEMIDAAQHPVSIVMEMPSNVVIPPNALSHGKHYIDTDHPHLYRIVVVSTNQLLQTLYDLFEKVYPMATQHIYMVGDLDKAREVLLYAQSSVPIF